MGYLSTAHGRDTDGDDPLGIRTACVRWADRMPDQEYLIAADGRRSLRFGDLPGVLGSWIDYLDGPGSSAAPGTTVAIRIADPMQFSIVYLALLASGRVAAPLDPRSPASDAGRQLTQVQAAVLITDRSTGVGEVPTVWTATVPSTGRPDALTGNRPAGSVLMMSSGTTGAPKRMLLNESQLLHTASAVADHHRLGPGERCYCPLPLFHVNAQVVGLLAALVAGSAVVLDDGFHCSTFWARVAEREATWINAVPAILTILAGADVDTEPLRRLPAGRLRFVRSASAPLSGEVRAAIAARTGLPVVECYGMTEAASQITVNPLDGSGKPGSAGRPVGVELRIAGTAPGEVGPVQIRGPGVITGYADPGQSSARCDADGWLDTGDLGRLDSDGDLFLLGRADDVINRGGEKVFPRQVEEVLLRHRYVSAAAVVGAPHTILGSVPEAFVVPRPGTDEDLLGAELRELCDAELARYKRPARIRCVAELPSGPTGKVLHRTLADQLARAGAGR